MPATPPHLMANGDINPCRFVKLDTSGDHYGVQATANSQIIGVSMEGTNYPPLSDVTVSTLAASQGQYFKLFGDGEACLLEAGAAVSMGDRLKSDSVGRGVAIATTGTTNQNMGAVAMAAAAAAGEKIPVQVLVLRSIRPT